MANLKDQVHDLFNGYRGPVTIKRLKQDLPGRTEGAIRAVVGVLMQAGTVTATSSHPMEFQRAEEAAKAPEIVIGTSRCDYCSPTNSYNYHNDHCPRTIPNAAGQGRTWGCRCAFDGHKIAHDFAEQEKKLYGTD